MRHRQLMRLMVRSSSMPTYSNGRVVPNGFVGYVGLFSSCPIDGGEVAQPPLAMAMDNHSFISQTSIYIAVSLSDEYGVV